MNSSDTQSNTPATGLVEGPTVRLPIELQEFIIDSLDNYDDAGTIAKCALVCRTWLPFSRYKLYSEVSLRYCQKWCQFKDILLRYKSEAIEEYLRRTRELCVWPRDDKQYFDEEQRRWQPRIGWRKGQQRPWAHLVLIQCAKRLTSLTLIHMIQVDLSPSHNLAIRSGLYYHRLTKLVLSECKFMGIPQLHQFVTSFPALSDLTLTLLRLHSKIIPSHIPGGGHPLTRLTLWLNGHDITASLSQWLSQAHLVRNLESLDWGLHEVDQAEEAWKTLTEAINSISLQELHCWMPSSWQVDLSRFMSLKQLMLGFYNVPINELPVFLNSILSSIASCQLKKLHCIHRYLHPHPINQSLDSTLAAMAGFRNVDDVLLRPPFHCLSRIQLDFRFLLSTREHLVSSSTSPSGLTFVPGSTSQLDLPDDISQDNPQNAFKRHAEYLVRNKIQEELKQFKSRGILDIDLKLDVGGQTPDVNMGDE